MTQFLLADLYLFLNYQPNKVKNGLAFFEDNIQSNFDAQSAFGIGLFHFNKTKSSQEPEAILALTYFYISEYLGSHEGKEIASKIVPLMTPEQISEAKQKAEEFMKQLNSNDNP